jgi:hypothetical protein
MVKIDVWCLVVGWHEVFKLESRTYVTARAARKGAKTESKLWNSQTPSEKKQITNSEGKDATAVLLLLS